ncbi:MAG: hypothetical protein PHN26_04310 [Eubacteriaceae bacterium]|nr:hypothetical protein [Eubacteriaceae bacterium]
MISFEYPVMCPLMGEAIDKDTCFDIHMVVIGEAPKETAPDRIFKNNSYIDICNNCKYHRND